MRFGWAEKKKKDEGGKEGKNLKLALQPSQEATTTKMAVRMCAAPAMPTAAGERKHLGNPKPPPIRTKQTTNNIH